MPPSLNQLVEEAKAASHEHREAQAAAQAAQAEVTRRYDIAVEAHASAGPDGVEAARAAFHEAGRTLDEAKIKAEGLGRKAERIRATVDQHMRANADDLIADLEPEADELVPAMTETVTRLVELDARWNQIGAQATKYVTAAGLQVQGNVPAEHMLTQQVRYLRNVVDGLQAIESPLPHWKLRKVREQQHAAQAEDRTQRDPVAT